MFKLVKKCLKWLKSRGFDNVVLLFIIDRLSKVYFLKKLSLGSFFNLHLNQNIAFSLTIPFYIC